MTRISKLAAAAAVVAAVALWMSTAGCSKSNSAKLEGRWVGDAVVNFSPQDVPMATGWALGTSFEFKGEELSVQIPAEANRAGTFEVVELDGDQLTIDVERPDGLLDTAKFRIDGERLSWLLGGERELVLRRSAEN